MRNSPAILTFSVAENMRPKLAWLRERMGLDADGISKLVGRNPRVLSLKVCWTFFLFFVLCALVCEHAVRDDANRARRKHLLPSIN